MNATCYIWPTIANNKVVLFHVNYVKSSSSLTYGNHIRIKCNNCWDLSNAKVALTCGRLLSSNNVSLRVRAHFEDYLPFSLLVSNCRMLTWHHLIRCVHRFADGLLLPWQRYRTWNLRPSPSCPLPTEPAFVGTEENSLEAHMNLSLQEKNMKMKNKAWYHHLLLLFTIFVLPFLWVDYCQLVRPSLAASSAPDFIRQPARSVVLTPHRGSPSDPQQVHISLVGEDKMRVSWITEEKGPSVVEYGTKSGKYESKAKGQVMTYDYVFYTSGLIHNVVIGPLKPNTIYYYRCGKRGPEFSFKTPPSTFPIEFAIVGDLGQTEWTNATLKHVAQKDYDIFLLPGDLSYADTQQPLWDSFGRLVEPYASKRPWMVTQGNHEIESIPLIAPEEFKAYNARWPMPYNESGSTSNLYYSFDVASDGVHIIMLGSYTDYDVDSDQYTWLKADLAKVNRSKTPWVIVLLHAPWYNSNSAHKGEGNGMKTAMEDLIYKARVDLVFAGHVHAYERFTRVYKDKADPCGPVYITIGDGGNREGLALTFEDPAPSISVYREPSFGHGRLRLIDEKTAHWSWQRNNDSDSYVADEVWLESLSSSTQCSLSIATTSSKDEL